MNAPVILDHQGQPMRSAAEAPYSAAGFGRDMASWQPLLASIDTELNGQPWETIAARSRDLSRNHGLASGAIETRKDSAVHVSLSSYSIFKEPAETAPPRHQVKAAKNRRRTASL